MTLIFNNIFASVSNGFDLTCVINKEGNAKIGSEPWWAIKYINETYVGLEPGGSAYVGTSEEKETYYRRTLLTPQQAATGYLNGTTADGDCSEALGTAYITYSGGWNTSSNEQDGDTFYNGTCGSNSVNTGGYGFNLTHNYIRVYNVSFCQYVQNFRASAVTNLVLDSIHLAGSVGASEGALTLTGVVKGKISYLYSTGFRGLGTGNSLGNVYINKCYDLLIKNIKILGNAPGHPRAFYFYGNSLGATRIYNLSVGNYGSFYYTSATGVSRFYNGNIVNIDLSANTDSYGETVYLNDIITSSANSVGAYATNLIYSSNDQQILKNNVITSSCATVATVGNNVDLVPSAYADNGGGLVRVTVGSLGTPAIATGSLVTIAGTSSALYVGTWSVTVINSTTIDLVGSTFTSNPATKGTAIPSFGWKITPLMTSGDPTANIYHPFRFSAAKIKCSASVNRTATAWITKSHATNVDCNFECTGGQVRGMATDIITADSNVTTRQSLAINLTPTADGVAELILNVWWVGSSGTDYIILDKVVMS
jgi:hypothetical protein